MSTELPCWSSCQRGAGSLGVGGERGVADDRLGGLAEVVRHLLLADQGPAVVGGPQQHVGLVLLERGDAVVVRGDVVHLDLDVVVDLGHPLGQQLGGAAPSVVAATV